MDKKIRSLVGLALVPLVLTCFIVLTPSEQKVEAKEAVGSAEEAGYRPGEILIKFKDGATKLAGSKDIKLEQVGMDQLAADTLPASLQKHKAKFEFVEQVYKGKESPATDLAKVKDRFKDDPFKLAKINETEVQKTDLSRVYKLVLKEDSHASLDEVIAELVKDPAIEYAEKNYLAQGQYTINDPLFNYANCSVTNAQVNMRSIGFPDAWDYAAPFYETTVAVIDSGLDLNHVEVATTTYPQYTGYWRNPGEFATEYRTDGIDNDNNGYIDDWRGWSDVYGQLVGSTCTNLNTHYVSNNIQDELGHGTHVSGIINARMNNSISMAGVGSASEKVKVMALKSINCRNEGTLESVAEMIVYAVDNGADVINLSLGSITYSQLWEDAADYAYNSGVLAVAAAGNSAADIDNNPYYPASFDNVLAVSALNATLQTCLYDVRWTLSNYGNKISVSAPGASVPSLRWNYSPNVMPMSGTSMAAPHVSALAAMILAKNYEYTRAQVKSIIESSVDDLLTAGKDIYTGYGRINTLEAMEDNTVSCSTHSASGSSPQSRCALVNCMPIPHDDTTWWKGCASYDYNGNCDVDSTDYSTSTSNCAPPTQLGGCCTPTEPCSAGMSCMSCTGDPNNYYGSCVTSGSCIELNATCVDNEDCCSGSCINSGLRRICSLLNDDPCCDE
jgi:subtilisin family serine protease